MTKGFWLSVELLHDKNTTMQEKLILIEISQLSMLDKGCIASNNHFAELLQVKKESVSRSISSLENKGYITTKIKDGSRNYERVITINKMLFSINKMLFDPKQNVIDPLTNCLETKESKTINKTINKKEFSFSLSKLTQYENVSSEYKEKLKEEIEKLNLSLSYEDFTDALIAKGYKYKNFLLAYKTWCKKDFNKNKSNITGNYDDYLTLWNEFASKNNLRTHPILTSVNKNNIKARLEDYKNFFEIFKYSLVKAKESSFLMSGDYFDFEWLIANDDNIIKVYKGKYDDKKGVEVTI